MSKGKHSRNKFNSSVSQGNSIMMQQPLQKPPQVCDPTCTDPMTNPFKMSERNKARNKHSSLMLRAPRGADRSAE